MGSSHYLVFTLEDQPYALGLDAVERVIRAVSLTRIPDAPEILMGLINMHGKIVPVLDIRNRFHLSPRAIDISDRMVISQISGRSVAIIVDSIEAVVEFGQEEIRKATEILPDMGGGYVEGVGRLNQDTVLIYDMNKLFSIEEIRELNIEA
ncbi:MAG: purine-binding chemotaxis protein CheW [Deltaproteobacteria bacterium]|nr:purine-binding chemotaxis protein CheW [Deltaproteobacteria bacterium]